MKIDQFIEKTQQQVSQGYIKEAIEGLKDCFRDNKIFYNDIIGLSGRFADLQSDIDSGILTQEEGISQKGQIRKQILNLLDKIRNSEVEGFLQIKPDQNNKNVRGTRKQVVYSFVVLGVVCLLFLVGVAFYWFLEWQNARVKSSVSVDTVTHQKKTPFVIDTFGKENPKPQKKDFKQPKPQKENTRSNARGLATGYPTRFEAFRFDVTTSKGRRDIELLEGEELRVSVFVNRPCFIRLIYKFMDGTAVLLDDQFISEKNLRSWHTLSSTFECAAPFGNEHLLVYAQSEAFPNLETTSQDGYKMIVASQLSNQLSKLEKRGDEIKRRGLKRKNSSKQKNHPPVFYSHKKIKIKTSPTSSINH